MAICRTAQEVTLTLPQLQGEFLTLLIERFILGKEVTIGVLDISQVVEALPPIQVIPSTTFYDYQAKYQRDDTRYVVGHEQIDLPASVLDGVQEMAIHVHRLLGCRHLSRIDFMIDEDEQPWVLEVNTMPGFTGHSLLPKAAAHGGIALPQLVDALVHAAVRDNR